MLCIRCQREISNDASYCATCGAYQHSPVNRPFGTKRLTRSRTEGKIAGVCAGIADYLGVDVTFIRLLWVVLSIVPGAIIGGVLAYLLAWLVMPEDTAPTATASPLVRSRIFRSVTDRKIAGVCGGLAEYFGVDSTPIRVLWLILTVVPGAIVCGVIAYIVAWVIVPNGPAPVALTPTPSAVTPT